MKWKNISVRGRQMKEIKTSFRLCYEALKLSCAVWPEVKAGKRITVDDIIELMQHGGDLVWWDGGGVNTGVSDLGSPCLNPPCMGTCEHTHTNTHTQTHTCTPDSDSAPEALFTISQWRRGTEWGRGGGGGGCGTGTCRRLFTCIVNFISPPATTSIFNILDLALSFFFPLLLFLLTGLPTKSNN